MKKYFYLLLLSATFVGFMAFQAKAQNNPEPAPPAPAPQNTATTPAAFRIARVEDDQVATLRNLRPHAKMLVYLGASAEAVQADATAYKSLQNWIKSGGVMAVYSDAATLFGFDLQVARQGNPQQGGQLFGRAVSAVPLGSEPLLWRMPPADNTGAGADLPEIDDSALRRRNPSKLSVGDPTQFAAITVYYQLEQGDSLLVSHPTATPLLRVTDLAQPQTNLFASAIASYGNGWVIFLPDQIESERAQGGQFLNNIVSMAADPPLPVAISAITATADSLNGNTPDYAPLLTELQKRLAGNSNPTTSAPAANDNATPADNNANDNTIPAAATAATLDLMPATLQVPIPIAKAMVTAITAAQSATPPPNAQKRVDAVVALWMLQAKLQRSADYSPADDENSYSSVVNTWLQGASEIAPSAREVLFWKGAVAAQDAANVALPSSRRAGAFAAASNDWQDAATVTPLLTPTTATTTPTSTLPTGATAAASTSFGDASPALLTDWAKQSNQAATTTALEPPVTTLSGRNGSGVIIRHFSDDPTLRLALPSIQKLQSLADQFGWIAPSEEVLVFPNEAALATYANRLGPLQPGERPLASAFGRYGRVLGNRILMVSQPSQPIILPGTPPRVIQTGTAAAAIVGRLHGELLLNALTEDGTPAPTWMRLGMMNLASDAVTVENNGDQRPDQELIRAGQANQLLSPDQFNAGAVNNTTSDLADMESKSLMSYFYQQFGAGAVMETAQRLGSGEDIDQALQATTQMNEADFFTAWYKAVLGNVR
jgi:hypothetical protein